MAKRFKLALFTVLTQALVASAQAANQAPPQMLFDKMRLPANLRNMIIADLNALYAIQFGPNVDNQFKMYFRGATSRDVAMYLLERVHYVGINTADDSDDGQMDPSTYAANYGASFMPFYLHNVILREPGSKPDVADFENRKIALTSPRVGFVGIGGAYLDPKTSQIDRIDTWVHEARHSDCAHIPSTQDLMLFDKDDNGHMSMAGLSCSHVHVPCPPGHPLANELACDVHPWGAYSAGYIFSKNVFRACTNCTEQQKQAALASASDDFSRLSPALRTFYRNPNPATPPDLSSFDAKPIGR